MISYIYLNIAPIDTTVKLVTNVLALLAFDILQSCLSYNVDPSFMKCRLLKVKINTDLFIKQEFINYELDKLSGYYNTFLYLYRPSLAKIRDYFDVFRFSVSISTIRLPFEECVNLKNQKYINTLIFK